MKSVSTRISAIALAVAIVASACGGTSSEVDAQAQAQIDELQARLDELTEQDAPVPTTTSTPAPTTTEADVVVEATTSTTVVEAVEPAETEPSAVAVPAESIDGFAVPDGPIFDASIGPAQLDALIEDISGPTTNLSGQIARVGPFPAVSTLPNSIIEDFSYRLTPDFSSEFPVHLTAIEVKFTTSALPVDVITAYQAELAALDGSSISSGIQNNDGTDLHWARVGEYEITAQESRAVTLASIRRTHNEEHSPETLSVFDGIYDLLAVDDAVVVPDRLTVGRTFGNTDARVIYEMGDFTEAELLAIEADLVAAAGWTTTRDLGSLREHEIDGVEARVQTSVNELARSEQSLISLVLLY